MTTRKTSSKTAKPATQTKAQAARAKVNLQRIQAAGRRIYEIEHSPR